MGLLYPKINSKWIKDLTVRSETVKLPEENTGNKFLDIDLGNDILDITPKAQGTEAKRNKWHYVKLKQFCTTKQTSNKMKRQPMKWEKICAYVMYFSEFSRETELIGHICTDRCRKEDLVGGLAYMTMGAKKSYSRASVCWGIKRTVV